LSEILQIKFDRIGGVMVSVVTSSAVDRGFEPQSDQSTEYKIDVCCFSTKTRSINAIGPVVSEEKIVM
jgi:hypothetical protein